MNTEAIKCFRCGELLVPADHFLMISGVRLEGESLACCCGFGMMNAELAQKLYAELCEANPDAKPYRISGCYGSWHYADNARKDT